MFSVSLGDSAELRPLEVQHAQALAANLDRAREHIRPWVGPTFLTDTVEGARATLARYAHAAADDGARLYGIWWRRRLVGGVMFVSFDAVTGQAEMGCWLEPAFEGFGLVTGAARHLLAWAFEARGLVRVEWRCRVDNDRSAAVAQRLGMRLEGVLRKAWLYDGVHHDKQVWAVLAEEYEPLSPR